MDAYGHVTHTDDKGETTDSLLQTLNTMVQMQAESVRLQRLLVERLLGAAALPEPTRTAEPPTTAEVSSPAEAPRDDQAQQHLSRGARYYQSSPGQAPPAVTPQHLDLLCRLQEMRDATDLILQFGPHRGTTLGQVAVHHPDYIRELASRAQRPAVRAAAARIVEALDTTAPPRRRTPRDVGRTAAGRGR
jgi:hypothetical protein